MWVCSVECRRGVPLAPDRSPTVHYLWQSIESLEPSLRRFLGTRCRNDHEIDDVIQETFLRAARYRGSLKDLDKLRPWAFRIAANVLADRMRKEARLRGIASEAYPGANLTHWEHEEHGETIDIGGYGEPREDVLRVLEGALAGLRSRDRDLIESFYGGAGSCRETADSCEVPEHVVKVRLYRARTRLRDQVIREVVRKRQTRNIAWLSL